MVRSLENFPELATFRMPLRAHPLRSARSSTGFRSASRYDPPSASNDRPASEVCHAGSEDPRLVAAEVIRENQDERRSRLRLVVVAPVGAAPRPAVGHLLGVRSNRKKFLSPASCPISMFAPSWVSIQCAVHHELHARAAGLVAALAGDVAAREQPLGKRDIVLGQETHLEPGGTSPAAWGSPSFTAHRFEGSRGIGFNGLLRPSRDPLADSDEAAVRWAKSARSCGGRSSEPPDNECCGCVR
jgi:hypothetical protein